MKSMYVFPLLALVAVDLYAAAPTTTAGPTETGTNAIRLTPAFILALSEEMRSRHPSLQAGESRVRAAGHATNAVRTWEDPMFTLGGVTTSPRGVKLSEDGDLLYGLEQKLPLFGKAEAARHMAMAEAGLQSARLEAQFQSLRRDLVRALFRAALSDRLIELSTDEVAWVDRMVATAEEHYRAGTGTQVDVLRLQNERARRTQELWAEGTRRDHERLSVNRLLNRDLRSPLPPLMLPDPARPVGYTEKLSAHAVRSEPRLRAIEWEVRQAEASVAAVRKSRLPEVSAGIEGRQYSGDGGFREGAFTVTFSLPWLNHRRYQSDLSRDQARLRAAELDAADYQLAVRESVHEVTVNIEAARREAVLYGEEILKRSELALEVAHTAWQANRGMLFDVLESRRMLVDARQRQARAVTEQFQMLSDLAFLCGLEDVAALERIGAFNNPTP